MSTTPSIFRLKRKTGQVFRGFLLSIVAVTLTACPGGEASSLILGNKIESAVEKINWGIERSIVNADYSMEKNLRTLQLMTTNIQNEFNKELERNRNFFSEEMSKNVDKIHALIDDVKGGVLQVEDFLVLDAQNVINQIPFKKDIFLIRQIYGYGTTYKESGSYSYTLIGNAFQPNHFYKVFINDTIQIDRSNIYLRSANNIRFEFPVNRVNNQFTDFTITRTKLKIECFENDSEKKPFFVFSGDILLLPKFPVSYVFNEFANEPVWSTEKYNKSFSFDLGPTGKEGKWNRVNRTITVDDAATQRFTRLVSTGVSGSHCKFDSYSFTPDKKAFQMVIANQCHDCSRSFFGVLEYEKLSSITGVENRFFESDGASKGLLTYGTHTLTLKQNYQLYELSLKFFNGEQVFLNKENMSNDENGCKVTIANSETGTLKRLALEIKQK